MRKCRGCETQGIFSQRLPLGALQYSGFFPAPEDKIPTLELTLAQCDQCGLVQLIESPDPEWMYGPFYGYRSSQNQWMIDHLKTAVNTTLEQYRCANSSDLQVWVDVGSNDGTLLSFVPEIVTRVGVDPNLNKFAHRYSSLGIHGFETFFGSSSSKRLLMPYDGKVSVLTSFSVFYDLDNPNEFVRQVDRLLEEGGLWVSEQSYFPSMLEMNAFDTICHEHLLYLTVTDFMEFTKGTSLRIEKVDFNNANGGSFRVFLRKSSTEKGISPTVLRCVDQEAIWIDEWVSTINKSIDRARKDLTLEIERLVGLGKKIYGLGASTKGNIFLEVTGTGNLLEAIGEVNEEKWGKAASGFGLPIVDESDLLSTKDNVFLVLPWHFKDNFIRNAKYADQYLLFALPFVELYKNGEKISG